MIPNSTVYNVPGTRLWYSVIVFPSSPNRSQIRYDIYSSSTKSETSIENVIGTQLERMIRTEAKNLEHSTSSQCFNDENKGIFLLVPYLCYKVTNKHNYRFPKRNPCPPQSSFESGKDLGKTSYPRTPQISNQSEVSPG